MITFVSLKSSESVFNVMMENEQRNDEVVYDWWSMNNGQMMECSYISWAIVVSHTSSFDSASTNKFAVTHHIESSNQAFLHPCTTGNVVLPIAMYYNKISNFKFHCTFTSLYLQHRMWVPCIMHSKCHGKYVNHCCIPNCHLIAWLNKNKETKLAILSKEDNPLRWWIFEHVRGQCLQVSVVWTQVGRRKVDMEDNLSEWILTR